MTSAEVTALHAHIEGWRRELVEAMQHPDPGAPMWAVVRDACEELSAHRDPNEPQRHYPWKGQQHG